MPINPSRQDSASREPFRVLYCTVIKPCLSPIVSESSTVSSLAHSCRALRISKVLVVEYYPSSCYVREQSWWRQTSLRLPTVAVSDLPIVVRFMNRASSFFSTATAVKSIWNTTTSFSELVNTMSDRQKPVGSTLIPEAIAKGTSTVAQGKGEKPFKYKRRRAKPNLPTSSTLPSPLSPSLNLLLTTSSSQPSMNPPATTTLPQ